mmetsp:Transcript_8117/g.18083  ORF Transcript_8117/g.18083 Transcript_8117/m.18083 type:complete len:607 (-) Transcript_8117:269-2089(-)
MSQRCLVAALAFVALALSPSQAQFSSPTLNGFIGPSIGKAMESRNFWGVLYPSVTFCAQLCDASNACRSFSWGTRGDGVANVSDGNGGTVKVGLCILSRATTNTSELGDYPDYDFYEESLEGPTADPSAAGIPGFVGPFTGSATSGIDDITDRGGVQAASAAECAQLCTLNNECKSFDFGARGPAEGICHLSRVDREEAGPAFTVWPLYDYYEKILQSIPEVVSDSSEVSLLSEALTSAELLSLLSGPGPFTVFAPSNAAFQKAGLNSIADLVALEGYERILEYHVALGRFESTILKDGDRLLTAHGEKLAVTVADGVVQIDGVGVVSADIECSNGVIHIMDNVLTPPAPTQESLMSLLQTRGFSILAQALVVSGLDSALSSGKWTLFAPSDLALTAYRITEGLSESEFLGSPSLTALLQRHVVEGEVLTTAADAAPITLESLAGSSMTMRRTPAGSYFVQSDDSIAAVGPFDIIATDGILHAIDRVLSEPERDTSAAPRVSEDEVAAQGSDDGGDDSGPLIIALVAVIAVLGCCLAGAGVFYYRRRKNGAIEMQIPEANVQQDGVHIVVGKPVGPQEGDAAAVAGTAMGGSSKGKAEDLEKAGGA